MTCVFTRAENVKILLKFFSRDDKKIAKNNLAKMGFYGVFFQVQIYRKPSSTKDFICGEFDQKPGIVDSGDAFVQVVRPCP